MRPFKTPLALFSIAATGLYLALTYFMPAQMLVSVLNSVFIGTVAAVAVVFLPLFIRAFQDNKFDRVTQLWAGITLVWIALASRVVANIYVVSYGGDASIVANSAVMAFSVYLAILGGILHVTAPHARNSEPVTLPRTAISLGLITGILTAVITLACQWKNGCPVCTH